MLMPLFFMMMPRVFMIMVMLIRYKFWSDADNRALVAKEHVRPLAVLTCTPSAPFRHVCGADRVLTRHRFVTVPSLVRRYPWFLPTYDAYTYVTRPGALTC